MDEDDLQVVNRRLLMNWLKGSEDPSSARETHAVGKIVHKVFNRYLPNLEFVVQPISSIASLVSYSTV